MVILGQFPIFREALGDPPGNPDRQKLQLLPESLPGWISGLGGHRAMENDPLGKVMLDSYILSYANMYLSIYLYLIYLSIYL